MEKLCSMVRSNIVSTVFISSFLYSLLVALAIQFIFLPLIFTEFHSGHGLMAGFDMNSFHYQASNMAHKVDSSGWSELNIIGSISGVAAFFYTITGIHEPYVLILFNVVVHSLSAVTIFLIIKLILNNEKSAFFGAIVFILLPTPIFWYAQMHKDGIFILGVFLFIFGWVSFLNFDFKGRATQILFFLLIPAVGNILSVTMRPYYAQVSSFIVVIMSITSIVYIVIRVNKHNKKLLQVQVLILTTISMLMFNQFITSKNLFFMHSDDVHSSQNVEFILDSKIEDLIHRRDGYIEKHGHNSENTSNIDTERKISNFVDIVLYIPRALQIGFFAPFPRQWLENSSSMIGTFMRRVNMLEMLVYYVSFIGALMVFIINKEKFVPAVVILYATFNIFLFTVAVPNIGTLHRLRYGYIMLIVCLGCAIFFKLFFKNKVKL